MKKCSNCGTEAYRMESEFCLKCGNTLSDDKHEPQRNICTNRECYWHKTKFIYPDDACFCDACGSKTVFAN